MIAKLCPFSPQIALDCVKDDCRGCSIWSAFLVKAVQDELSEYYEPSYRHLKNEVLGVKL